MRALAVAGALISALPASAEAFEVHERRSGALEKRSVSLDGLPRVEVEAWDVLAERRRRFSGYRAEAVLDRAFGERWRRVRRVRFHCADGYAKDVSPGWVAAHDPVLADRAPGAESFSAGGKELGPLYLVWPKRPEVDSIPAPYQIEGAELIVRPESRAQPPRGASPAARTGYRLYTAYCQPCHAVNGVGGRVGPELNYPTSVTEYIRPGWVERWMLEPKAIRHGTAMPGLPEGLEDRRETAQRIVAYLEAMAKNKRAPPGAEEASDGDQDEEKGR